MESKAINFDVASFEVRIIYFLKKMYYGLFTYLEQENSISFKMNNFQYTSKGLLYDDCFFALDFDDYCDNNLFRVDLELSNGISSYAKPGLYVYGLAHIFKNDNEQAKLTDYIIENIDKLEEIDRSYKEIEKADIKPFNNDASFLLEIQNENKEPIQFKNIDKE